MFYVIFAIINTLSLQKNIMKIKIALLSLLISVIGFSGCEKAKDITDVKFDANYSADLNINVTPGRSINGTFSESVTIDPASNEQVEQYLDLIKSWEVQGVSGEFIETSNDFMLLNLTFTIASEDKSAEWNFSDIAVTTGTSLTLDNSEGQWDTVNQILAEKQSFTVAVNGETEQDDVQFTLRITIETEVTANPLN
jgi:hypothetical protein